MCPPVVESGLSFQQFLDTAICVRYFGVRRRDEHYVICLHCYVHEDLNEEEVEDVTYEGVTGHYLHIGSTRNLELCHNCRDTLYSVAHCGACEQCTRELQRYSADVPHTDSIPRVRESVILVIERAIITTEWLNFPNFA